MELEISLWKPSSKLSDISGLRLSYSWDMPRPRPCRLVPYAPRSPTAPLVAAYAATAAAAAAEILLKGAAYNGHPSQ